MPHSYDPLRHLFAEVGRMIPARGGDTYERETPEIIVIALREYLAELRAQVRPVDTESA